MMDPNAPLWRIRRELDEVSERIDRLVMRTRRTRSGLSRSRRQAVESLRHKRDTLLIRFWMLERHGEASWHNLHAEIDDAWGALREEWRRVTEAEEPVRAEGLQT